MFCRLLTNFQCLKLNSARYCSTIFALSTGIHEQGSAIAIVRVSGPGISNNLSRLINSREKVLKSPRKAILAEIKHPKSNKTIDHGMVLWFPKPKSYTGEDVAEFHVHGSKAVVSALLDALGSFSNFRPAEEGEFTRRAFYNGKMTLAEVEALSYLISAQTENQRIYALKALKDDVHQYYSDWIKGLSVSLAHMEAVLNFGEDEAIDDDVVNKAEKEVSLICDQIKSFLEKGAQRKQLIQNGVNITIVGPPNAGKSTLMNKICQRNVSIVSEKSGTTRDIVENFLDLKGWKVRISDTAGLRSVKDSDDMIELEGMNRARERALESNVVVIVLDGSMLLEMGKNYLDDFRSEFNIDDPTHFSYIYVINKVDLLTQENLARIETILPHGNNYLMVSCKRNLNIELIVDLIDEKVKSICNINEIFINERHVYHLTACLEYLQSSLTNINYDLSITCHLLRQSVDEIGKITGKVTTEDVLGLIFSSFCIGK